MGREGLPLDVHVYHSGPRKKSRVVWNGLLPPLPSLPPEDGRGGGFGEVRTAAATEAAVMSQEALSGGNCDVAQQQQQQQYSEVNGKGCVFICLFLSAG